MIILEDGLSLNPITGIGNYTLMLAEKFKEEGKNFELKRKPFLENIKNSIIKRSVYFFWLNSFLNVSLIFRKKPLTLLCTNYQVPFFKIPGVEYVSVIYDLCSYFHPDSMTKIQVAYSQGAIKNAVKISDKIITDSETVKNEIAEIYNYPKDKIEAIHYKLTDEFVNAKTDQDLLEPFGLVGQKYLLSVGTLNKRKNIGMLVEAFDKVSEENSDLKLVLVGSKGNAEKLNKDNNPNIIFTDYVDIQTLKTLYSNALLYVFPSIYEGFGIPILEAQHCNVPILCSDIPVFREVAGDSVDYFDLNIDSLEKTLKTFLETITSKKR